MSETSKKSGNAAIACGDMKAKEDSKGIIIEQGNYGPSKNEINNLAGMIIEAKENTVTNELNGKVSRIDKNGKKFPVEAHYTTIGKKLEEIDRKQRKDGQDR